MTPERSQNGAPPEMPDQRLKPNAPGHDTRRRFNVLKDGDLFAVFDDTGALNPPGPGPGEALSKDGLFFRDTRYLSRFVLFLNGTSLTELGNHADDQEAGFRSDLANTKLVDNRGTEFPEYALHVRLERFLSDGLYDRIIIANHALDEAELGLEIDVWADFRDIFEVRGLEARNRGELQPPSYANGAIGFEYHARDGRRFATRVEFDPEPVFDDGRACLSLVIPPKGRAEVSCVTRVSERGTSHGTPGAIFGARHGAADLDEPAPPRDAARKATAERVAHRIRRTSGICTSRPAFDAWLARSSADLAILTAELGTGPYPYAGVPWFSAPFGRDGIIAAIQTLWLNADLAAGVLDFLASTQANRFDAFSDAEPGKIIHEHRNGEMACLGAVPFHHYYGGIDQTLLFVMLAHAYWRRTGDLDRISRLEHSIRAALDWAKDQCERSGDGFIKYKRSAETGLKNQGWKDSEDAIFYADGSLCASPVGLVEVQGYHVAALRSAAGLFEALGCAADHPDLRARADALVDRIDAAYWDDELGTFCIALDGEGRRLRVSASNAGHLLYCDAVRPERRQRLIEVLTAPALNSGWGIRTLSTEAALYNPMGYHNGSVWPHDTSIVAAGLARAGAIHLTAGLTAQLFAASTHFHDHRLPELWCGMSREESATPIAFPAACAPQAWAAGAPFLCLQACLGLDIDATAGRIGISHPVLPDGVDRIEIDGLRVGKGRATLSFRQIKDGTASVEAVRADGGVRVDVMP